MNYALLFIAAVSGITAFYFWNISKNRQKENTILQARLIAEEVKRLALENSILEKVFDLFLKYKKIAKSDNKAFLEALRKFFKTRYNRVEIEEIIRISDSLLVGKKYNNDFKTLCNQVLEEEWFVNEFSGKIKNKINKLVGDKKPKLVNSFYKIFKSSESIKKSGFEIKESVYMEKLRTAATGLVAVA